MSLFKDVFGEFPDFPKIHKRGLFQQWTNDPEAIKEAQQSHRDYIKSLKAIEAHLLRIAIAIECMPTHKGDNA